SARSLALLREPVYFFAVKPLPDGLLRRHPGRFRIRRYLAHCGRGLFMTEQAGRNQAGKMRLLVARGFTRVEDVLYVGLGLLLAGSATALLVNAIVTFGKN